jgi:hypothetical protein
MGAYRYGRPHVGYQALMATALLTYQGALGYVTELLSGDFNAPFGRSSHHQVWSEAMVVTPLVRGLFGIEVEDGGRRLAFAPQLPADWDQAAVRNVAVGSARLDIAVARAAGRTTLRFTRSGSSSTPIPVRLAPALPLDARVRSVSAGGRALVFKAVPIGDVQRVEASFELGAGPEEVVIEHEPGSEVFARVDLPDPGARSSGLRILRSRAEEGRLRLVLEGVAGRTYPLGVRSGRTIGSAPGVTVGTRDGHPELQVAFEGPAGTYVRREIEFPLQ